MESECQGSSTPMVKKVEMQAACHGDEDKGKEGATADNMGCFSPIIFFEEFNLENLREWDLRSVSVAKAIPNDVIVRDPIPQWVRDAFYKIAPRLEPILEKDGVRCFLRFFESEAGMQWDLTITSQTLTHMVIHNAMRCAKVVLEGKEQELNGMHANPNCINPYGYFPLHEAAEKFSIDMIKLLFRHGACANVRTVGDEVIENLLPLHVAVENACLHKYLEDNLSPTHDYQDYIYKLICLLCLPEMKIFLDTIRLLAEKTDNLVDEVWNYIKEEKLVQTTVLLLAAQGQIRGGRSSKRNGNGRQDGFHIIIDRIVKESLSLRSKRGESGNALDQLEERIKFNDSAYQLLSIIFQAGEELNVYIQEHSEVPHVEVLQRVSSILKDTGFCPTGEGIDVSNLRPYDCKMSDRELCNKDAAKAATATAHAAGKRVMRKKLTGGWDPEYTRRMFFPYWRSVLAARCRVKVYPSYAPADAMSALDLKELRDSWSDSTSNGSLRSPKHDLSLLGRIWQPTSNHQSRRLYSTTAFTLLKKVLRK